MNTLILNGSLNKNGNTEALLKIAKEILEGNITEISAYYDHILPCLGCSENGCSREGRCHRKDKLSPILDLETGIANEFDNIILASPIRISGLTSSMMTLAERFQLWYVREEILKIVTPIKTKQGGIILVGGGYGTETRAISQAKYILNTMRASLTQEDIVTSLNTDHLPAAEDKKAVDNVRRLALKMNRNNY